MRSFFSRFTADSASPASPAATARKASEDAEASQLLSQASEALDQLRVATSEDWPLLNKTTRLVQQLDACVSGLRDTDKKLAWRR